MISFKQFLEESRSAPLYHGTTLEKAISIIKSNVLEANNILLDDIQGVSFTRNLNFARAWIFTNWGLTDAYKVVFEVDQQKLNQNYKISPFNYFNTRTRYTGDDHIRNEYEERIIGRNIKNFDRYVTKVIIFVKPGKPIKGNVILNHPKLYFNGKFVNR